ncbi:PUR family DNA/RNA-binding protein [Treponema putidum]|uniref:DUF3276 family protein n=1 Tax=Treponema putidum TaxID=221027 RepID=A0AAE9MPZ5_9SPIR|nr:PUR family DNA/RNA-binding protein [Treponema putidum]AIN93864.1 hypothetical protein JO40_06895 [Treponema putidum]TWI78150.1 uncharacterized protein DUF3276 [Treponema putidum]UTY27810.1 DUF3276 family protein [Treponema putidum]UTY30265.1 DUF3276 family protein [Treponema putidum]UTY32725.1 DUF3276 family protein [Treponema putidum]
MGIRGELFTIQVSAENRTYFFNVKENTKGDVFLQVVESKASEGLGFDRHAVVVFEDEMRPFLQGLDKCIEFIEKNRKEKAKAKTKKILDAKKSLGEKSDKPVNVRSRKGRSTERPTEEKSKVKKVIKKKDR